MKYNLSFIVMLLLLISSCASASKPHQDGDNTNDLSTFSVDDEKKMTQEALISMSKDYPPLNNPRLQAYINSLGNKIIKNSNLQNNPYDYTFTVVDSKQINAFALPAGTVFVTYPLLKAVESEAELAGVIGHEIGHVEARHTAERMTLQANEQKKNILWIAGSAAVGLAGGYMAGKKLCPKDDKECLAKVTLGGGALGAGASLMVQKYRYMQNSQTDELEADRLGFKYATQAGFDANSVGKFYSKLLAMEKSTGNKQNAYLKMFSDAMSTHPPSEKRVEQMNTMARNYPTKKGVISGQHFLNIMNELK